MKGTPSVTDPEDRRNSFTRVLGDILWDQMYIGRMRDPKHLEIEEKAIKTQIFELLLN